jgi:hypothetical protein
LNYAYNDSTWADNVALAKAEGTDGFVLKICSQDSYTDQ